MVSRSGRWFALWFAYLFWSISLEFIAGIHYLYNTGHNASTVFILLAIMVIQVALSIEKFRNNQCYKPLLFALATIGIIGHLLPWVLWRVFLMGLGFAAVFAIQWQEWRIRPNHVQARWFLLMGLLYMMAMRWGGLSIDPLWAWWPFTLVGALLSALSVVTHKHDKPALTASEVSKSFSVADRATSQPNANATLGTIGHNDELPNTSTSVACGPDQSSVQYRTASQFAWVTSGLGLGGFLFLGHSLFTTPNLIPRWVGLMPTGWGISIAIALGLGIYFAGTVWSMRIWSYLLCAIGMVLLCYGWEIWGMIGAWLLALMLPAFGLHILNNISKMPYLRSLILAKLTYLGLLLTSEFAVIQLNLPGGRWLHERPEIWLWGSVLLLGFGTGQTLCQRPSLRLVMPPLCVYLAFKIIVISGLIAFMVMQLSFGISMVDRPSDYIKVMSYNIRQSYDDKGRMNFPEIQRMIYSQGASLVALHQSETLRISSANRDVVSWLSTKLNMFHYAGASPRQSTIGNALLSTHRIINPYTLFLPSHREVTALLVASIVVRRHRIHVLVLRFGTSEAERVAQARTTAAIARALTGPLLLMVDFNSKLDTELFNVLLAADLKQASSTTTGHQLTVPNIPKPAHITHNTEHIAGYRHTPPQQGSTYTQVFYRGLKQLPHPSDAPIVSVLHPVALKFQP
jgi:endonuclease/exonuclease/phosphatase family metal-dependent hydrolase